MTADRPYSIERPVGVSKRKRAGDEPTNPPVKAGVFERTSRR